MTKQRTRRALLSSLLSLLLCCSMLIGTTFAWFTDNVTSTNNIIKSGNLDVELSYKNDETSDWTPVDANTNVFKNDTLWEPGHTEVVKLKVSNEGTLALKYQLGVNIFSETGSINQAGDPFQLSDHIKFAIIDGEGDSTYTREKWVAEADAKAVPLKTAYQSDTIKLYPKEDTAAGQAKEKIVTMVVYMPTTVENEANYGKGQAVPTINLGLNLVAMQYTYEEDSFDDQYDKDADDTVFAANLADLREVLANGGKVALAEDIIFTDEDEAVNAFPGYASAYPAVVQINKDTDLYLNGNDFAYAGTGDMYYLLQITDGATVNIYGNSDSVLSSTDPAGTNAIAANRNAVVNIYGGTYTSKDVSVVDLNTGAVVNVYGGFFYADTFRGDGDQTTQLLNTTNGSTATFHTYGGTYVNFDPRTAQDGQYVPEGYTVVTKTQDNGEIWYTVVKEAYQNYTPTHSVADIKEAVKGGEEVLIATDIVAEKNTETFFEATGTATDITVDGNGSTITANGDGSEPGKYGYVSFIPANGEDATISNVKVAGSGFVSVGIHPNDNNGNGSTGGDYTVDKLVIEDLVATLTINNGGNNIAGAFTHYGNATLTDCVMTGTTTLKDGYKPYDAAFVNGTKTVINGGKYGAVYLANQAHVTVTDAEIDVIDSYAISYKNLGNLTIGAGAKVGTINLTTPGSYKPALVIEDGAEVGVITYKGVSYTPAEWQVANP